MCIYDEKPYPSYDLIKSYRTALLKNEQFISLEDYGSGSRVFKSDQRKISHMAKTAGSTIKKAKLLHRIVCYFKPSKILELGTSLGIGTLALASGNRQGKVVTIEGSKEISAVAKASCNTFKISNVDFEVGTFEESLNQFNQQSFDLVFFDGHHSKEATLNYFNTLLPTATNTSVWIFDDIYWSTGMTEAWETIKSHHQVQVSVDLFHFGIVFFRIEQAKEHFKIRF